MLRGCVLAASLISSLGFSILPAGIQRTQFVPKSFHEHSALIKPTYASQQNSLTRVSMSTANSEKVKVSRKEKNRQKKEQRLAESAVKREMESKREELEEALLDEVR